MYAAVNKIDRIMTMTGTSDENQASFFLVGIQGIGKRMLLFV